MANEEQLALLKAGVEGWNEWRREPDNPKVDLTGADLRKASLFEADLTGAELVEADLGWTNLRVANLVRANLESASLMWANLSQANLIGTSPLGVSLVGTTVDNAKVSGSKIYAINVWDLKGEFQEQENLVITPPDAPSITVDNIKVAQFIYLILNNKEIRDVINTLTSKAILILGRFAIPERKAILDALRNKLREYDL